MRTRECLLLAALAAPLACAEDDPSAVCHGDRPVHLVATDNLGLAVRTTATDTFVTLTERFGEDEVRTFVGPACGASPHEVAHGVPMLPVQVALDPDDDDPTIVCDHSSFQFFRLDPDGVTPPALFLPYLDCHDVVPTVRGPVFPGSFAGATWWVPDFPDDTTAEKLIPAAQNVMFAGDALIYTGPDPGLRRLDLETREDREILRTHAFVMDTTPTHVLWRAAGNPDIAPMHVLDLARGTSAYLGLWRELGDEFLVEDVPRRGSPLEGWRFDPTGRFVVHVPLDANRAMEASALDGDPVSFPAWGTPLLALDDGSHVIRDGEEVYTTRPDDPAIIVLDWSYSGRSRSAEPRDGYLELQSGSDLVRVPLDGGPQTLIAHDIGVRREWLDEHHILTIFDDSLYTVRIGANVRRYHGVAREFVQVPGRGVYYNNVINFDAPHNGIWFVPDTALLPVAPPCITSFYCR